MIRRHRPVRSLRNYRRRRRSCNSQVALWQCAFLCLLLLFKCDEVAAQQQQQVTAREQDDRREKKQNHKNETLCWKKAQQHWQSSSSSLWRRGETTRRPILPSRAQSKDAEKAYRMAALSGLAYWNFHWRVMPRATTSFQLVQDDDKNQSYSIRRPATRLIVCQSGPQQIASPWSTRGVRRP